MKILKYRGPVFLDTPALQDVDPARDVLEKAMQAFVFSALNSGDYYTPDEIHDELVDLENDCSTEILEDVRGIMDFMPDRDDD